MDHVISELKGQFYKGIVGKGLFHGHFVKFLCKILWYEKR